MKTKQQGRPTLGWLIFSIWPLGAVFYAFKNYKRKWAKNLLWGYVVFYGYIFKIPENSTIDANHYRDYLHSIYQYQISLSRIFGSYLSPSASYQQRNFDILNPLLTWVTAQFTNDYHILYLLVGVVFGFFFSRNMWWVLNKMQGKFKFGAGAIVFLLFFIIPPWNMNGIRFWTASQIFIYGIIRYYDNDKKGIWVTLSAILMHFSFVLPIILMIVHKKILKDKYRLYFLFFLITLPLSILTIESFTNIVSSIIPEIFQQKLDSYTSDEIVNKVQEATEEKSTLTIIYQNFRPVLLILTSGIIFLRYKKLKESIPDYVKSILCYALMLGIVMNIVGFVPSIGRFNTLPFFLFIAGFLLLYQNQRVNYIQSFIWILLPFCLLFPFGAIRYAVGSDLTGTSYFYQSPVYLMLHLFI